MIKDTQKKLFIALAIFVATCALSFGIIFMVLMVQLDELHSKYVQTRTNLGRIEQKADLGSALKKELETISPNIETLTASLLKTDETLLFLENVENIAQSTQNEYQVTIAQEIHSSPTDPKVTAIVFGIEIRGTFHNTLRFMRELKQLSYITTITQISMDHLSADGDEENFVKTSFTLKIFVQ